MHLEQLSFLPTLDDAEHASWLLNGKQGVQNDCGVYVENVFRFREGKLSGVYVEVDLCAEFPTVQESKPVTYRELARLLAEGNGEVIWSNAVYTEWSYINEDENKSINESLSVRKWEYKEWHKPTREYLGLEN